MTFEQLVNSEMYNSPPPNCPLETWQSICRKVDLDKPVSIDDVIKPLPVIRYTGYIIYFDKDY